MQKIHYVKIQNFKVFSDEIQINFDNPTVLIGANNSGKTSVIQALALWSWAVKILFDAKKNQVLLNRLDIPQMSLKDTCFFWHQTNFEKNNFFTIKVGFFYENHIQEIPLIFTYHTPETIYVRTENTPSNILSAAAYLSINLLYPMVGMKTEEDFLQENTIKRYIGRGQSAAVLRNICFHLYEKDEQSWAFLTQLMKLFFAIEIQKPFLRSTGTVEVLYNYSTISQKTETDLDISLAGYGQQQMLLVLAYLLANRNSVLMIDEPDAHLEILRQSQIFSVLKEVAQKYDCQIIIVTHSEVVLNEADSVIFLADGNAQEISDKNQYKFIKNALRDFGIEHYYKAKLNPHILYVEGSTDIEMLKTFAKKFNHSAKSIFEGKLHFYYTKNEISEKSLENELNQKSGAYKPNVQHFQALKSVVPNLKAIGIFDNDNQNRQDEIREDWAVLYWKKYELENYFIHPKTILAFAKKEWEKRQVGDLLTPKLDNLKKIIDEELILPVLNHDQEAFRDFKAMPESLQNVQFQNLASTKKLSELLENVFEKLAVAENEIILLRKGNFYQLIDFLEIMPQEVKEKLDFMEKYLL